MSDNLSTTVVLTCLCGNICLPGSYLQCTTLPVPSEVCHCNPCRYSSGGLLPGFSNLYASPPESVISKLTPYQFTDACVRYFCSTCGTHCFVDHPLQENDWYCSSGIIQRLPNKPIVPDINYLRSHIFIDDIKDAGLIPLFLDVKTPNDVPQSLTRTYQSTIPATSVITAAKSSLTFPLPGATDKLSAKCHCGGISILLDRPDYITNPHNVQASYILSNPHKYSGAICACQSCCLATGQSLHPWIYASIRNIRNANTNKTIVLGKQAETSDVEANQGLTLKFFWKTDRAQRSFCAVCGATAFYFTDEKRRKGIVDVAAGLLRAESGAMAREWVEWNDGFVSCAEEGIDQALIERIKKGWKAVGLGQ